MMAKDLRILIAEDNPGSAEMMEMLLQHLGYQTRSVSDGEMAIRLAEEFLPHAAFIDLHMPLVDGFAVASRVQAQPWGTNIALVALTGDGDDETRTRARQAGFREFVLKPIRKAELKALLKRIL